MTVLIKLLILLFVEAGVEVVVAVGVVAVAPLPHKVLIFTPCNVLIKLSTPNNGSGRQSQESFYPEL
jgi:hypothetical protein